MYAPLRGVLSPIVFAVRPDLVWHPFPKNLHPVQTLQNLDTALTHVRARLVNMQNEGVGHEILQELC